MVDRCHLEILTKGISEWNNWRRENPTIKPNLSGADLHGAVLDNADLSNVELRKANLFQAKLNKTSLIGSDLREANLSRSRLTAADLSYANLFKSDLTGAKIDISTFYKANLKQTSLRIANMYQANLRYARLDNADLTLANLSEANLFGVNLSGAEIGRTNFSKAILIQANLRKANTTWANLQGANLTEANLSEARILYTDLDGADLNRTNLQGAFIKKSNLNFTKIIEAQFGGATLKDCCVFGISTWGLIGLSDAKQSDLIITPEGEPIIKVDNLEIAQFIYLMLHNEKIRDIINTIGKKGVLVLGRFTERKDLLEAIRLKLSSLEYIPIIFDFEKPTDRDFTETVLTLAGLSKFIIADITHPQSVPLELKAIIPNYKVPMVTIIEKGQKPFSMFKDLWIEYNDSVLEPVQYSSIDQLLSVFQKAIVDRATKRYIVLQKRKNKKLPIIDAERFEEYS